ncbi:uncharacterized protein YALI1_D06744g [Yarrowia lipolytica]|uniref:Uncharacterized protein n=1 Tax=Yarrowia lipolytica TaxID=4952 RepID=A0A1D8ND96_YARLL|nr:hypothetical protein YALI1_D06744g [Yarrowia lipolytica]
MYCTNMKRRFRVCASGLAQVPCSGRALDKARALVCDRHCRDTRAQRNRKRYEREGDWLDGDCACLFGSDSFSTSFSRPPNIHCLRES